MRPHDDMESLCGRRVIAGGTRHACTSEQESTPRPTLTSTTSPRPPPSTTDHHCGHVDDHQHGRPHDGVRRRPPRCRPVPPTPLVPLLIGGADSAGWLFLGAWQRDSWQESSDPSGNPIRPGIAAGTPFTVSNLDGETQVELGENTEACFDDQVGPAIDVDVSPPEPPGFGYNAVAVLTQPGP